MDQALFLEQVTPGLTGLLVLTFVCVVVGVFIGVRALTRGRTVPLLGGLVAGPLLMAALGLTWWGAADGEAFGEEAAWRSIFGLIGPMMMVPFLALIPAFLHALLAAVAGARGPRRRWWVPAAAAVPMLVAVAAPTVGGWLAGGGMFPLGVLRTVMYAVLGMLTLPALLGGGEEDEGGPEAGAASGLAFATVVGLGEAAGRALFWFLLLGAFALVERPVGRLDLVERMRSELLSVAELWSAVAVLAAIAVGVLALVGAARGGRRTVHAALGGLWLALVCLPLVAGDVPARAWADLARALPEGPTDAPASPIAEPPGAPPPPALELPSPGETKPSDATP